MANPQNRSRKKKSKFVDNQHTSNKKQKRSVTPPPQKTLSSTKKESLRSKKISERCTPENENYFILINFQTLSNFIEKIAVCQDCSSGNVVFTNKLELRMGLACKLQLLCKDCSHELSLFTSDECKKSEVTQGRNMLECNVRAITGFREIGKGHEAITNFTRCMNMHTISEPSLPQHKQRVALCT